jgi:hypothetical protein
MLHAQYPRNRRIGGLVTALNTLLRGEATAWPALDGFCRGPALTLPAGEVFAQEGVELQSAAEAGARVMPSCEEAWIAGRDGQECWYALWCPYADRWEILRFELGQPARDARRPRRNPNTRAAVAQ